MGSFNITFDADGTVDTVDHYDSDSDFIFFDDCNDAPDGLSSDYIATAGGSASSWLRLEDVPADFADLLSVSMDVDVQATGTITGTITAQIFDSDSGGSENPLTDSQQIASDADSTRTQRTVNFGSLAGTKTQWNAAHCKITIIVTGGSGELRLYGAVINGVYSPTVPELLKTRPYLGPKMRLRYGDYGAQMLNKAVFLSRLTQISEEHTLLLGSDPVVEGGNLASGRWRR